MPNNYVFDSIAQDLKTQIFGNTSTGLVQSILTDTNGAIIIGNTTLTIGTASVTVAGVAFTSLNTTISGVSNSAGILAFDSSQQSLYSYYVKNNNSTNPITFKLQVSPTTTAAYYTDDSPTPISVDGGEMAVLVPKYYLNYTRLFYDTGGITATFEAYMDARI